MILQLLRQLNNLDRCSASFCFDLSLRFPYPLPERISSRILSKSMFIPQNHPKSQQRVRKCAVKEKPVFRASLTLSMLEIELYQISLPYDRGRSGYEINPGLTNCIERVTWYWGFFVAQSCGNLKLMTLIRCKSLQTRPRINYKRGETIEVEFFRTFCHNNVASLAMVFTSNVLFLQLR